MENALIAGFSAASASLFGKLTFGGQALSQLSAECLSPSDPTATTVSSSLPAVRWSRCWVAVIDNRWELVMGLLLPLTMMILSNVAMYTYYTYDDDDDVYKYNQLIITQVDISFKGTDWPSLVRGSYRG
jgi:hypothetical protein